VKRLFLAVDIDDTARSAIGRISSELRLLVPPGASVSWVRPERMHLTLHFFGAADAVLEQQIRDALAGLALQAPFDLSFDGLGWFPPRGAPRVLWLAARDGVAELQRLHQLFLESFREANGPREVRATIPYRPHLTLARFRPTTARGAIKKLEIKGFPASAGPCRIDRVTLYESRLSPAGPTYVRLAETLLTGSR
jgi:2'-5' RNA ligase